MSSKSAVRISSMALARMLHSLLVNNCEDGRVEGFLLGTECKEEEVDDASDRCSVTYYNVTGVAVTGRVQSFYGQDCSITKKLPEDLIGWFRGRSNTTHNMSAVESAVHTKLQAASAKPLVFALVTVVCVQDPVIRGTLNIDYSFFTLSAASKPVVMKTVVPNMKHSSAKDYKIFNDLRLDKDPSGQPAARDDLITDMAAAAKAPLMEQLAAAREAAQGLHKDRRRVALQAQRLLNLSTAERECLRQAQRLAGEIRVKTLLVVTRRETSLRYRVEHREDVDYLSLRVEHCEQRAALMRKAAAAAQPAASSSTETTELEPSPTTDPTSPASHQTLESSPLDATASPAVFTSPGAATEGVSSGGSTEEAGGPVPPASAPEKHADAASGLAPPGEDPAAPELPGGLPAASAMSSQAAELFWLSLEQDETQRAGGKAGADPGPPPVDPAPAPITPVSSAGGGAATVAAGSSGSTGKLDQKCKASILDGIPADAKPKDPVVAEPRKPEDHFKDLNPFPR